MNYLRLLPNKKSGLSLFELLIVAFILGVILSSIFLTLNIGHFSFSVNSAKLELQSYVRHITDQLIRDVRDTNILEINSNNPSTNHIKFRKVTGIDNTSGNYTLATNYIEYSYDNVLKKLSRNIVDVGGNILQSSSYANIVQSPFYSAAGVALAANDILTTKKLVIVIASQKQPKQGLVLNFSLTEEIKIRNE